MPYRIKARSTRGHTVTRMDLDPKSSQLRDSKMAQQLADDFALTRGGNQEWTGIIEYYRDEDSIANPRWNRDGAVV